MDIHLDILLDLPNVTVFTCEQVEGFTVLKLKLLNDEMNCPHCHSYTDYRSSKPTDFRTRLANFRSKNLSKSSSPSILL